jgi:hypothetical protein
MKPLPLIVGFTSVSLLLGASVYAAKGDKVDKGVISEKRMEKIERKLERAGVAEAAAAPQRQVMGAAAEPDRSRSDRGDRGDRGDQGYSSRSRSSRDRGEYREPTTPADAKYDSFRIIVEKNIFNPTRIGRTRERSEERAPRVDTIALVGTMQSDKGVLAFFDSPDASYRKTLREGQSVGDFKVQKIAPNEVEVVRDGKSTTLKVGQQFRRPEGGDWSVANAEARVEGSGPTSAASAVSAEPPPIPADASDALRRLMEARQKQLKQ